ncbi:SLC13 family permease [Novosphingobium resinovorum]
MPLAFATILGGMTTLIGTPTNLILSSVREARLGTPFGFFTMTPVGVAVTVVGLVYLCVVGWRLLPVRTRSSSDGKPPWRVYELSVLDERLDAEELRSRLRAAGARMLASFRDIAPIAGIEYFQAGTAFWSCRARTSGPLLPRPALPAMFPQTMCRTPSPSASRWHTALRSSGLDTTKCEPAAAAAAGRRGRPRVARERRQLVDMRIRAGDQLYIRGPQSELGAFSASARVLEIDRHDPVPTAHGRAAGILAIFAAAIACIVGLGLSPRWPSPVPPS